MDDPTPQYLPREHVETFRRHRALSRVFDQAFRVPGTRWRFGLDALLGLFPGIGDLVGAAFAGYGILLARRMGVPPSVQLRMIANVAIDSTLGAVPVAGDVFDAAFKAHRRNHALLERWLERPRRTETTSRLALWAVPVAALLAIAAVAGLAFAALAWALSYFDSASM
ncbi:MAG: DUF4112 domain-containing protein [Steroidobacteraceae bacterium]|nr:DUF4112 domain-containing protein [Steroidobacteraceae bacterium]